MPYKHYNQLETTTFDDSWITTISNHTTETVYQITLAALKSEFLDESIQTLSLSTELIEADKLIMRRKTEPFDEFFHFGKHADDEILFLYSTGETALKVDTYGCYIGQRDDDYYAIFGNTKFSIHSNYHNSDMFSVDTRSWETEVFGNLTLHGNLHPYLGDLNITGHVHIKSGDLTLDENHYLTVPYGTITSKYLVTDYLDILTGDVKITHADVHRAKPYGISMAGFQTKLVTGVFERPEDYFFNLDNRSIIYYDPYDLYNEYPPYYIMAPKEGVYSLHCECTCKVNNTTISALGVGIQLNDIEPPFYSAVNIKITEHKPTGNIAVANGSEWVHSIDAQIYLTEGERIFAFTRLLVIPDWTTFALTISRYKFQMMLL